MLRMILKRRGFTLHVGSPLYCVTLQCLFSVLGKYVTPLLAVLAGWSGFVFVPAVAAESPGSSPSPIEVLVDGKAIEPSSAGFRIPASHKSVSVRLGTPAESSNQESRRMR